MAYAAVVSLTEILNQLINSTDDQTSKPLIDTLFVNLCGLQASLEQIFPAPKFAWIATNDLETKIRDTIYKAQDTVETLLISCHSLSSSASLVFLQGTIAEVDSLTKTSEDIRVSIKEYRERDGGLLESENALPSVFDTNWSRDDIVGQDKNLKMLKDVLLDHNFTKLQVVPIVGMVGIGKTTLAKCIYDDPHIQENFSNRAWLTVSPEYPIDGCVLLSLIGDYSIETDRAAMSYEYLTEMLRKTLYNTKYLLVIDDVCDYGVWDKLEHTFPDNKNGSRVILTTKNADLACYTCYNKYMLRDPFLDDDESWNLLCKLVFTNDSASCPSGPLEIIGRKIAKGCEGLPLAIIEIGKILRGTEKTVQKWKEVEESDNPLIVGADVNTPLSKELYRSYKNLPPKLKACFLYMGILPRNTGIRTSKLIELLVAEGFIQKRNFKNIEVTAEDCLDDLVSQSLVLVRKHSSIGATKTLGMHFVFRSLCITEAPKEGFLYIVKKLDADGYPQGTINSQQQRLCFHNNVVFGFKQVHESLESISSARSLLCLGPHHPYPVHVYLPFRLLRVLDLLTLRFYEFPNQVLGLVWLRYLAITCDNELPPSISRLFNLEVLIFHRHHIILSLDHPVNYLPIEIWNLHRLRHLHCIGYDLPDPSMLDGSVFLKRLKTLSGVSAHSWTEGVLKRMPKLKKIGIRMVQSTHNDLHNDLVENFGFFNNFRSPYGLDRFKCVVLNPVFITHDFVSSNILSSLSINIRKITLSGCGFPWYYMSVIGKLDNLEVLKLRLHAFRGKVCDLSGAKFGRLRFLLLEDLDLECWKVDWPRCFRVLKHLIIKHCYKLKDMDPRLFNVLKLEVDNCSLETEDWAREMEKKKNDKRFRVQIHSSKDGNSKKAYDTSELSPNNEDQTIRDEPNESQSQVKDEIPAIDTLLEGDSLLFRLPVAQQAQERMRTLANKHRIDREFSVGDYVILKLHPYRQSSVARRKPQKLLRCFFGPFPITERIGSVLYRLELPTYCRIHPVFHVSLLEPFSGIPSMIKPGKLPKNFMNGCPVSFPIQVHDRRSCFVQGRLVEKALVEWSEGGREDATWEAITDLTTYFAEFHLEDKVSFVGGENDTSELSPNNEDQTIRDEPNEPQAQVEDDETSDQEEPRRGQRDRKRLRDN